MKFYNKQGAYSYKDINHIKYLLFLVLTNFYSSGWLSPNRYSLENNIAYDLTKERSYYGNEYISIYCERKQKKKVNSRIIAVDDNKRIRHWIIIKKAYLFKLGFGQILDENDNYY